MSKQSIATCPVCGAGELTLHVEHVLTEYRGESDVVEHRSHKCSDCLGDFALSMDSRENKRALIRFRKMVDGIPLGCEIRHMREQANLTQVDAGKLFGGGPVAFSKYEADDLIPGEAMVHLLKLAIEDGTIVNKLKKQNGAPVRASMFVALAEVPVASTGIWESGSVSEGESFEEDLSFSTSVSYNGAQSWTM